MPLAAKARIHVEFHVQAGRQQAERLPEIDGAVDQITDEDVVDEPCAAQQRAELFDERPPQLLEDRFHNVVRHPLADETNPDKGDGHHGGGQRQSGERSHGKIAEPLEKCVPSRMQGLNGAGNPADLGPAFLGWVSREWGGCRRREFIHELADAFACDGHGGDDGHPEQFLQFPGIDLDTMVPRLVPEIKRYDDPLASLEQLQGQ